MPTAGAILGAAVIGGGASALSASSASHTQANAALQAAQLQSDAANRATDMQLGIFNTVRGDLSPYNQLGQGAIPGLARLMGIPVYNSAPAAGSAPGVSGSSGYAPAITSPLAGGGSAGSTPSANWNAYVAADPGMAGEYERQKRMAPGFLSSQGINSLDDYARWHWDTTGHAEDGRLNPYTGIRVGQQSVDPEYANAFPQAAAQMAGTSTTGTATPVDTSYAGAGYDPQSVQKALEATPGYQFTKDQGLKALSSSLLAKGFGGGSGAMGKGLTRFITGLADQTYGNQVQRMQDTVKIGANAAATSGQLGTQTGSNVANTMVGGAQAAASGITGAANASAAGTIATGNAIAGVANAVPGAVLTNKLIGMYAGGTPASTGGGMSAGSFTAPDFLSG